MCKKIVPGTVLSYEDDRDMFSVFRPLISATDGLSLSQVCAITGLEGVTVQNWIRRGFVAHPERKKYGSRHLARILLISALRECMKIDRIGELMTLINGDTDDERDDIVSEEGLYSYFCETVRRTDETFVPKEELMKIIEDVTSNYSSENPLMAQRLKTALLVMVYTYISGEMKRNADESFEQLKTL